MSEVKKIATRDSYGNALVELGKKYDNLVVLDADLAVQPRLVLSRKLSRNATLTAVLQRLT